MELYWTSRKTINGLKHFVIVNQYKLKKEVYLDFVSVLDESISFSISKKVFMESSQWIKGWNDIKRENINIKEYLEFKSSKGNINPIKLFLMKHQYLIFLNLFVLEQKHLIRALYDEFQSKFLTSTSLRLR